MNLHHILVFGFITATVVSTGCKSTQVSSPNTASETTTTEPSTVVDPAPTPPSTETSDCAGIKRIVNAAADFASIKGESLSASSTLRWESLVGLSDFEQSFIQSNRDGSDGKFIARTISIPKEEDANRLFKEWDDLIQECAPLPYMSRHPRTFTDSYRAGKYITYRTNNSVHFLELFLGENSGSAGGHTLRLTIQ